MVQFVFEHATNLWFLLAIPAIAIGHYLFLRHMKKHAMSFANFRALKRVTGERLITKNYLLLLLRLATILFLVLCVSGLVVWHEGKANKSDFVVAIDTSSSMSSRDVVPSRLGVAKADAKLFVESLDSEARIGVLTFSGVSLIQAVPSTDRKETIRALSELEVLKAGGTDIPGAIITSTNLMLDTTRGRSIVLLTDGSNTIETFLDASMQRALAYAKGYHVRIHAIGIGSNTGPIGYLPEYYNVSATYNEDNLLLLANATGGIYIRANSTEAVREAFAQIAADAERQQLRLDLGPYLLLIGLACLFLEWVLGNTRYRSVP